VGYNGSFKVAAAAANEIGDWELSIDAAMLDVTKLGDAWKDMLAGIKSWNGKAGGRWDMTDTNGQLALQSALTGGTSVTLNLYVSATHFYSGTAWIKAIQIKDQVEQAVDITFTFDGTGPLTYT